MSVVLLLLLTLLAPQSSTSVVQGVVVRAGTMQPLSGQVVGLWPTTRTVQTDAEGRFLFRDVAFGEYSVTVVRDGIKVQLPVVVALGRRLENLTVEVRQAPAISGTVFDPNGERVAAARIQAFRTVHTVRGPTTRSVMSVLTDDLGEFRLFWLRAGEYSVAASLNDRDQRIARQGLRLSPNLSNPDEGLPTIYFGGGYTQSESQRVRLGRDSDTPGLQLFLKDGPRYTIAGPLLPDGVCARVLVVPEGGIVSPDTDFETMQCGYFRVAGLSRGTYAILATNDSLSSEVIRVSTVNPVTEVKIPMVRTISISGRVGRDAGVGALTGISVRLSRSSSDISQELEAPIATDGTFTIPSVGPGVYDVSVQPLPEKAYLRTVNYRGFDGLFSPITVDSSGVPTGRLDIQMSSSFATAEGIVVDRSGRPVPGAEVVLVPRDNRNRTRADRYLATTADAGGNFRVTGIPPLEFALLAFEEIEPQAYFAFAYDFSLFNRSIVRAPILTSGASNAQLRLVAVPASETAGGLR